MIKDAATQGLKVNLSSPTPHAIDIDVNSEIKIQFNSELNPKSIIGSFSILEDTQWIFTSVESIDRSKYAVVQGSVSCDNHTLVFTPTKPLKANARYIVLIKANGIRNIFGSTLFQDYVLTFYTEAVETLPRATFLAPKFGLITQTMPVFNWADQKAKSYVFHISTSHTFDTLVYEELILGFESNYAIPEIHPSINLKDGMYYGRVRAQNGHWSEPLQFYINLIEQTTVVEEDFDDTEFIEEYFDNFIETHDFIESYPNNGAVQLSITNSLVCAVFQGHVKEEDIDWEHTYMYGENFDETDDQEPHGYLDGHYALVYDQEKDITHLVFCFGDDALHEYEDTRHLVKVYSNSGAVMGKK